MQLDKNTFVYVKSFDNNSKTGFEFILEKFNGDVMTRKLVAQSAAYDSVKKVWHITTFSDRHINGLKEHMAKARRHKGHHAGYAPRGF